jgi:glycine/D-amino acid oxidase-like deaminating enzyme
MSRPRRVLICGGGVIGAAIAYFLSLKGARPVVIERHEVAGAASGKSGGFLALDWCRGTPVDRLARRSFVLHAELAVALGNPWGFRRLTTYAGHATAGKTPGRPARLPWLSDSVTITGQIGAPETTAIVEPRAFTTGLMRAAVAAGAEVKQGTVRGLTKGGVALEGGENVEGDAVVIAMGPWSNFKGLPQVYGFKGHSLIFKTGDAIPAEALFLEYQEANGEVLTPEIFPRADGTVWACAISSTEALPWNPADVAADAGAHARLEVLCRSLAPALEAAPIVARQACFRPVVEDGLPLIGKVPGVDNAYVATGHSVWGMLNAPATGEAMAELILDGAARHVDLASFAAERFAL